ncbi:glycine-rich selenoprotein-like [Condylostylus longicornis]|uniref:glycine-rich selenoprotein-like n=1 Tax=Condylostylus longicornis TaxID=2530218 RepID=UPI00244DC01E|nr:glycine-rich selenoprotein-like [Condylostylus longicornis]
MVYIGSDGRVYEKQPWSVSWFLGLFTGFYHFLIAFFSSLISPLQELQSSGGSGQRGGWGPGGGGGSGSGRPGDDGRGNGPRNRRVGRIMRMSDCVVPGGG